MLRSVLLTRDGAAVYCADVFDTWLKVMHYSSEYIRRSI